MQLAEHPFFHSFPPESRQPLASSAATLSFPESTDLFHEGDPSNSLYLILEGEVTLSRAANGDQPLHVATLRAGDYFGELGLLDGSARSTGARVIAPATLVQIDGQALDAALAGAPAETFRAIFSRISDHLRKTNDLLLAETIHKEKMTVVGEMASGIIHDFRSPFTTIDLARQMIEDQHDDAKTARYCGMIDTQIKLMVSMMNEILEFARGTRRINREPVEIPALFTAFEAQNRLQLENKPVELVTRPVSAMMICDAEKILRVLQNLFNNAVDSFDRKPGKVILTATGEGDRIRLSLQDNGPGIPESIQANLFEPFVTKNKNHGTGLGLAVAKSVIQAHDGDITFETHPDTGTTFHIFLPAQANE